MTHLNGTAPAFDLLCSLWSRRPARTAIMRKAGAKYGTLVTYPDGQVKQGKEYKADKATGEIAGDGEPLIITDAMLAAHVEGTATYAIPLIGADGLARALVIELDDGAEAAARTMLDTCAAAGLTAFSIVCKGTDDHDGSHTWALYAQDWNPERLREQSRQLLRAADLPEKEVYPSNANIRLPFGLHVRTDTRGVGLLQDGRRFALDVYDELLAFVAAVAALPRNTLPPPAADVKIKNGPKPKKTAAVGVVLPLDDYNARCDRSEVEQMLSDAGWAEISSKGSVSYWARPGKKARDGHSATLGYVAGTVLSVFSTSDGTLPGKNPEGIHYSPAAIYAHLKHDSDFEAAAKALYTQGYGTRWEVIPPDFDADDRPHCPRCGNLLRQSKNGHGWRCWQPATGLCYFWEGDDAHPNSQGAAQAPDEAATIDDDDPRPLIGVRDLDIPEIVAPAWDALIAANAPPTLFRRDGVLYELSHDDAGALILVEADKRRLRGQLSRVARFYDARESASWLVEPPSVILDDMLVRIDPRVPILTRITRCPVITPDSTIVDQPGYHAGARLYYDPRPGLCVPPIPVEPTAEQVAAARALILDDLLGDFPFVDAADRAHAVALLLLPFAREIIAGPTPLHLIEAPTQGSGKTLLASVLMRPALGAEATPITEGRDDAEWQKKITSVLGATPAAVLIDNVNRPLSGSALSTALTSTVHSDRLLGSNTMTNYPIRCAWLATANNPEMSGEMARRAIRIRIDPKVDQPWKRDGFTHPNLLAWTREHEGSLVAAALTLIRAGLAVEAPDLPPLGSFEHWTHTIGRILHAAGIPGFLGNLDELYDRADAEGAAWRALVAAWWEAHQDKVVGVGAIFEIYKTGDYDLNLKGDDEKAQRVAFGKRFKKQQDRVIGGYQVVNAGTAQRVQQWQLKTVAKSVGRVDCVGFDPPLTHMQEKKGNVELGGSEVGREEGECRKNGSAETYTTSTTYTHPQASPEDSSQLVRPGRVREVDLPPISAADLMAARHKREAERVVSVQPWTDGPDRVEVSASRVQELIDSGLSKAEAQRQAVEEARTALAYSGLDAAGGAS
jgi:hypothetical protein